MNKKNSNGVNLFLLNGLPLQKFSPKLSSQFNGWEFKIKA
jgi:hypothetical protein